ncbi:2OG-Fe(II) oxygenase family protein [Brevundimonas sp. NIBR11]|uniref:2OG-Fe(II) oxygenase n=1 Tax=Brevundimonas sp. NIBR11 TaxID=3015999 RepID=UPI0022F047AF|nr:2OG-Fe(II) oxygenase family protein [Brevundimonas sp. NIBR11]WGM30389.1 hypothetical protein KKHFBJBL_00612 [Brevundimonas sp. NIBR11]
MLSLRLNRGLQPDSYRPVFKSHRRLHIPGILDAASAAALHALVAGPNEWTRSVHLAAGQDVDILVSELEALTPEQRAEFERSLVDSSSESLKYVFDTVRISSELDGGRPVSAPMRSLHDFVNGPAFLDFFRRLTGDDRVAFADVMATRYLPGHFAGAHGDHIPGQHRLYAYVLNLTPDWRADWGGVLMFQDEDGHIAEGYTPKFNALNVFAVPQTHAVSMVTRLARAPRLSVTGWIHARD